MEGDTSTTHESIDHGDDNQKASEEVKDLNKDKSYCDVIPIIISHSFDNQVSALVRKEERSIPIEIIGTIDEIEEDDETLPYPLEIKSNRTSLIITHDDGTTEENECEVTCLGVTPDFGCKSDLQIEEIILESMMSLEKVTDNDQVKFNNEFLISSNV